MDESFYHVRTSVTMIRILSLCDEGAIMFVAFQNVSKLSVLDDVPERLVASAPSKNQEKYMRVS